MSPLCYRMVRRYNPKTKEMSWIAKNHRKGGVTMPQVVREVSAATGMSRLDVESVLRALQSVMESHLLNGEDVRTPIGRFRVSVSSTLLDDSERNNPETFMKKRAIRFLCDKQLEERLRNEPMVQG